MKKFVLTLLVAMVSSAFAFAADMTVVWNQVKNQKNITTAPIERSKAEANGLESLDIALNSAPTSNDINAVKKLLATINENQKVTNLTVSGVEVSVYQAPYDMTGKMEKVMFVLTKDDNADKALILLYGVGTVDNVKRMIGNLNIADLLQ